jgi:cystathionine beta-synthase
MSKEWFLKNAFDDEHSDLAVRISGILAQEEADPVQRST